MCEARVKYIDRGTVLLIEILIIKKSGDHRQIQISRKPDEILCRAYEMLLMTQHRFWSHSVTKPNEKRITRIFLEHLGMQSHLEPNNRHIHLYFFFTLTTTTKHSACCDMVKCSESLLHEEGQCFQEVIGLKARLVKFLLQKVALWETSQGEENISV